ncbi:MAG TPA: cytochrome c [Steroidobacteraceae bacterium]|jgi:mono/diheme cytochrome c family protein
MPKLIPVAAAIGLFMSAPGARAQDEVARGRYLAALGDCTGCHASAHGSAYSGGQALTAAFGTVYSSNITPDRQTGIGTWTALQFYQAMHDGLRADGAHLYPAFPYVYFTRISRADSDAIFAFLQTVPPVHAVPPPNRLVFPLNYRAVVWFWNAMFLDKSAIIADASKSPAWNRGARLVNGLGHCGGCHTPKNMLFGDEMSKAFTGANLDHWFAANLTPAPLDGLGRWSQSDIVEYLKTGRNGHAAAAGSMQEVVSRSTSHLSDEDLAAIATYLSSLPAAAASEPAPPGTRAMQAGEALFAQSCSMCHLAANPGTPPAYPKLANNPLVQERDPETVVRIILQGAQSAATADAATGYSMPAFVSFSDQDIADVATYIRNTWGNHASAVSRDEVSDLRTALGAGTR